MSDALLRFGQAARLSLASSPTVQFLMRNDPIRLAELRRLMILDSQPERDYDDITNLLDTVKELLLQLDAERSGLLADSTRFGRDDCVVPFTVKLVGNQVQGGHCGVIDFDPRRVLLGV